MSGDREHRAQVRVVNTYGLHARPAAELVTLANRFQSEITIAKDSLEVNAKSIMGVMMLAAERGSTLTIAARGEDAEDAVRELAALVQRGFGES